MAYVAFSAAVAIAVSLVLLGVVRTLPVPPISDAEAQACCWAPKSPDSRCYPCRPTRESNTP
jgi:hypothetical protein